jgi:hypothetical protein
MLTKRERLKIVLRFLLLGPLFGGLVIGIPVVATSSDNPIAHIGGLLYFLLFAYPVGFIPAIVTGSLMQWLIALAMRRSISLRKLNWFLLGAFAGAVGTLSLGIFMIGDFIQDFRAGKSLGPLIIILAPGTLAGGICTLIALQRLQNKKNDEPVIEVNTSSIQPKI